MADDIDDLLKEYDKKPSSDSSADDIDHLLKLYPDTAPAAPVQKSVGVEYGEMPGQSYRADMATSPSTAFVPSGSIPAPEEPRSSPLANALTSGLQAVPGGFVAGSVRGWQGTQPILTPYAEDLLRGTVLGNTLYAPAAHLFDVAHGGVNALMSGVTGAIGRGTEGADVPALGRDINTALAVAPFATKGAFGVPELPTPPSPRPRFLQEIMAPAPIPGQSTLGRINQLIAHDIEWNDPMSPLNRMDRPPAFMPPGANVPDLNPASVPPAFVPPNALVARTGETGTVPLAAPLKTEAPNPALNTVIPNGLTPEQVAEFRNIPEALPPMKGEIKTPEDAAKRADEIINHFASIGNREPVPGAVGALPTITGNSGLATLYRAVRDSDTPVPFTTLENTAKQRALSQIQEIAGTADDLTAAKKNRADTVQPLYEKAWANKTEADPSEAISTIEDIMKSPAKQNDTVMAELPGILKKLRGETDPEQMKGITDNIDATLQRLGTEGKADRETRRVLGKVDDAITAVISKATPGFDEAQAKYSELSRRIDEMSYLQGRNMTDLQGNPTLRNMRSAIDDIAKKQAGDKFHPADSVTPENYQTLKDLHDQMQREAFTMSAGKSLGSNTFQNLATNTLTGKIAGHVGNSLVSTGAGLLTDLASGGGGAGGALTGAAVGGVLRGYSAKQAAKAEAARSAGQQMLMRELRDRLLNIDNKGVESLRRR